MRQLLSLFLCLISLAFLQAQSTTGLVAYYPFDGGLGDATGNTTNNGMEIGSLEFACGVIGDAAFFDGIEDEIVLDGPVQDEFSTTDFTVSLYFKPGNDNNTTQYLLSKRWDDCRSENVFYLRYQPFSNALNLYMAETTNKSISIIQELDPGRCWQHVVIWRKGPEVRLYVNGELSRSRRTTSRIDIENPDSLVLGGSPCRSPNETLFNGQMDELRFYNRALDDAEIGDLFFPVDEILTSDTLIFLGESVGINLSSSCASTFDWTPPADVTNFFEAEPIITPSTPGQQLYFLEMQDDITGCTARDSIEINVIDPSQLNCNEVFLPNAFTPNGDGLNDVYGISNPYAIPELITFEIFDRWGERVFATRDAFQTWDGAYRGQEVNSGVFLYKVRYLCQGEEIVLTGSITLMR
jgi:gliding motility-associated-like protein